MLQRTFWIAGVIAAIAIASAFMLPGAEAAFIDNAVVPQSTDLPTAVSMETVSYNGFLTCTRVYCGHNTFAFGCGDTYSEAVSIGIEMCAAIAGP